MLKYFLLGLAVVYVAWKVFKAVMEWADRRKEAVACEALRIVRRPDTNPESDSLSPR